MHWLWCCLRRGGHITIVYHTRVGVHKGRDTMEWGAALELWWYNNKYVYGSDSPRCQICCSRPFSNMPFASKTFCHGVIRYTPWRQPFSNSRLLAQSITRQACLFATRTWAQLALMSRLWQHFCISCVTKVQTWVPHQAGSCPQFTTCGSKPKVVWCMVWLPPPRSLLGSFAHRINLSYWRECLPNGIMKTCKACPSSPIC